MLYPRVLIVLALALAGCSGSSDSGLTGVTVVGATPRGDASSSSSASNDAASSQSPEDGGSESDAGAVRNVDGGLEADAGSGADASSDADASDAAQANDAEADASGADAGSDASTGSDASSPVACKMASDCPFGGGPGVADVRCTNNLCEIVCLGESYDVDGNPANGCEVLDICPSNHKNVICAAGANPLDDHSISQAVDFGSYGCTDASSALEVTGLIPSDTRVHDPQPEAFDSRTGAAPDFFSVVGTGSGVCKNDANFQLQMQAPTRQLGCYELHLLTDMNAGGQTCTTDLTGLCSITNADKSYGNGTTIHVWVTKSAACPARLFTDAAPFLVSGHL